MATTRIEGDLIITTREGVEAQDYMNKLLKQVTHSQTLEEANIKLVGRPKPRGHSNLNTNPIPSARTLETDYRTRRKKTRQIIKRISTRYRSERSSANANSIRTNEKE